MPKPLTVDHNKLWKILKEMGIPDHLTYLLTYMQVRKQQLELDKEQQTCSKQEKEYIKAVLSPCLFNFYAEYIMRNAELKLESRLLEEISIASDMQMTPPLWQKVKKSKKPLDESESGE